MGVPPNHPYTWIFPSKSSILGGTPIYGNPSFMYNYPIDPSKARYISSYI